MNKHVRLTKSLVEETFDSCNQLYFNGEIKKPAKFVLYTYHPKCVGMVRGIMTKKKFVSWLHISNSYHWTMENLRDTIVHEMIHLYLGDYLRKLPFWALFFPKLQHSKEFSDWVNYLNSTYPELNVVIIAKHMRKEFKG